MQAGLHPLHCHSTSLFAPGRGARQWLSDRSWYQRSHLIGSSRPKSRQRQGPASASREPQQQPRSLISADRGAGAAAAAGSLHQIARCFNGPEVPNGNTNGRGKKPLPTQGDAVVEGPGEAFGTAVAERDDDDGPLKGSRDLDYLAVRNNYCLTGLPIVPIHDRPKLAASWTVST